jgi:hypothetical protein
MEPEPSEEKALADHLATVVLQRLVNPLEILLGGSGNLEATVVAEAQAWAAQLLGDDDQAAARTAIRIIASLYPGDAPFDPPAEWWRTPLGQVVIRRVGHPLSDAVSYSVAGAMLGITRQGVHDLVTRGKLARHPEGGVTVDSIRARLRSTPTTVPHTPTTVPRTPEPKERGARP